MGDCIPARQSTGKKIPVFVVMQNFAFGYYTDGVKANILRSSKFLPLTFIGLDLSPITAV